MVPEETLERAAVDDVSPRYLRKQKPAEVKRRRARAAGPRLRHAFLFSFIAIAAATVIGLGVDLFFYSRAVLLRPGNVEISGEHFVSRDDLMAVFSRDMGRSVLRVPLDRRLATIEEIPWVKSATLERALPNRLVLQVVERQPVAFLSTASGLKLIDDQGVILDRPPGANFNLPVVTGIDAQTPPAERASRLALFAEFLKQIQAVRSDAASLVSEANLASADDVEATLAGGPALAGQDPVVVHFGDADFAQRFSEFLQNIGAWQVRAGSVEAVDLRYTGQALVTPESPVIPQASATGTSAAAPPVPLTGARKISVAVQAKRQKRSMR